MRLITTAVLTLAISAGAAGANAKPGLKHEADINEGLLFIAAADKIRRACDGIGGRLFKAQSYANALKDAAADRGYTDDEIDAYINSSENKAEMRARRNAFFHSRGASNLDAESLCALGREEIAKKSRIGRLLKAK